MKTSKNSTAKTVNPESLPICYVITQLEHGKATKQWTSSGLMERADRENARYVHATVNDGEKGAEIYVNISVRKDIVGGKLPQAKKAAPPKSKKFIPFTVK